MTSLLERKLIVVAGKGGAGKTTVACALGLLAARSGLRTVVAELGDQHLIPALFAAEGSHAERPDAEHTKAEHTGPEHRDHLRRARHAHHGRHAEVVELQERLWGVSIDPERALIEWLQTLTGRISARLLAASSTFQYFAAAAPGAKELVILMKVRELCEGKPTRESARGQSARAGQPYDLVILDAPATGHALAMLRSPQTFSAIVRAGPLAEQAQQVRELLEDPARSGYVAVTHATEMAVTETLELEEGLRLTLDRDLDAIVVNGTMPRRFTKQELGRIVEAAGRHSRAPVGGDSQTEGDGSPTDALSTHDLRQDGDARPAKDAPPPDDVRLVHAAARTARAAYERARIQQSQIARLRRQRFAEGRPPAVLTVPFAFTPELDLDAVRGIAGSLQRRLAT